MNRLCQFLSSAVLVSGLGTLPAIAQVVVQQTPVAVSDKTSQDVQKKLNKAQKKQLKANEKADRAKADAAKQQRKAIEAQEKASRNEQQAARPQ